VSRLSFDFKRIMSMASAIALCVFSIVFSHVVLAEDTEKTISHSAAKLVEQVTSDLLATARDKKSLLQSAPDQYYAQIRGLLAPAVDFETIAKLVMGKRSWLSIDTLEQQRFVNVFTDSLVKTYGKAMTSFVDLDIKVEKVWPSENPKSKSVYVQQDVTLDSGLAHIVYTLSPVGELWMVRNVTIRDEKGYTVNMGKTFNAQFKYELTENKGNVIATIDGWGKK